MVHRVNLHHNDIYLLTSPTYCWYATFGNIWCLHLPVWRARQTIELLERED